MPPDYNELSGGSRCSTVHAPNLKPNDAKFLDKPLLNSLSFVIVVKQCNVAGIAQLVEQRTENPRVGGSIPPPGINQDYIQQNLQGTLPR